ncbi:hypothetical protein D7X88_12435 [bacterium C-53]|nr:hypothetical protein [Lachnospiraceae bacterium]NBI03826.1 hypothetical protein [Lachnospiraceae bacterium]RKJ09173.1 hypothetical protein D7X88_12435 [bacterium C-53]
MTETKNEQQPHSFKRNIGNILQPESGNGRENTDKNTKKPGRGSCQIATAPRFFTGCRDWIVTQ